MNRRSKNEAWMDLHRLAMSIDEAGFTRQDRFDSLVHDLLAMPPLVRRELLRGVRFLLAELTDVEPLIIQAVNAAEDSAPRHKIG